MATKGGCMKRILLVDDDAAQCLVCQKELEREGYQVLMAADGLEAIECFKKEEKVDLVVLDIRMPQMDGMEVLGKLIFLRPGLPIILYTAFDFYRDNFLSWAADAYILKSPDITELKTKIKDLFQKETNG